MDMSVMSQRKGAGGSSIRLLPDGSNVATPDEFRNVSGFVLRSSYWRLRLAVRVALLVAGFVVTVGVAPVWASALVAASIVLEFVSPNAQ